MNNNKDTATSKPEYSADQTTFSAQEPLYESASLPQAPVDPVNDGDMPPQTFFQRKEFKIGASIAAAIALLVVVVIAVMFTGKEPQQVVVPSPSPTASPVAADEMQQRINQLAEQLLTADPSDDNLPLPPVDLEINLEE